MVAQAIDRLDASVDVITDEELDVDFNPRRFLRWMTRNGLLEAVRDPENNAHPIVGFRLAAWPPKPSVLNAKPIGLAYHIYRWFGSELQTYITSKMKEVETAEGLIQLDYAQKKSSKLHPAYKTPIGISTTDQGIPCATGSGVANPRSGKEYAFDTDLLKSELDLGRMNLRWVASNSDPLFEGLSRYERHILYLYFVQERSWKQIAKACRKGVKTVVEDYHAALEKAP
jgi:hypothetical protein